MTSEAKQQREKLASAGFAELERRGFRVGASDLGIDDLVAVFAAMRAVAPQVGRQVPYSALAYGAKFKYAESDKAAWVKVGRNVIAGWEADNVATTWVAQPLCSFCDDDNFAALVWLVDDAGLPGQPVIEPEQLHEAIAGALGEALDCTRVWAAWGVGTMSDDDFVRVADDQERLDEIATACLTKIKELSL